MRVYNRNLIDDVLLDEVSGGRAFSKGGRTNFGRADRSNISKNGQLNFSETERGNFMLAGSSIHNKVK